MLSASQHFQWSDSTYRSHEGGTRTIGLDDADTYAKAFGVTAQWIMFGTEETRSETQPTAPVTTVPIVGTIGMDKSGRIIPPAADAVAEADLPISMDGRWEAILVNGTALAPVYRPGSLLLYRPVQHDITTLVDHECVIETSDGRQFVRYLYPEDGKPGLWSLESDSSFRMANQEVKWASPIRLIQVWQTKLVRPSSDSEQA